MGGKPCDLEEDQLEEAGTGPCEDFIRQKVACGLGARSKHAVRVHVKSTTTVKTASGVIGKVRPFRRVQTLLLYLFCRCLCEFACPVLFHESQGWTDCTKTCRGGFPLVTTKAPWLLVTGTRRPKLFSDNPCQMHVMSTALLQADRIELVVSSVVDAT